MYKRVCLAVLLMLAIITEPGVAARPDAKIEVAIGGETRSFTQTALLARADAVKITVPHDVAYRTTMSYCAVPLADLIGGFTVAPESVLEAVASDGFAAQLPMDLVNNSDPATAVAYLAVEDPARPWPKLPGKQASAGPFYLVWLGKRVASIRSEQWPYEVAHLTAQTAPAKRWPGLAVDPALPATDPVRAGQSLFVTECLACHRLNHAGGADLGPDLNLPMNPSEYFQAGVLHRYIRDPASVRHWPAQRMPAFGPNQLSDREIDLIIAYLNHMARRKMQ